MSKNADDLFPALRRGAENGKAYHEMIKEEDERAYATSVKSTGYHVRQIEKGELGEYSKIREEFEEFTDAHEQGNKVMELIELSDILGAIEFYLREKYNGSVTMQNLQKMSETTQRAFISGARKK